MNPWENEEFVREVYTQTKKRLEKEHQMNIIALFHVENHMEAYMEDAGVISDILNIVPRTKVGEICMVQFPEAGLEAAIAKLTGTGLGISLSEIRDENGTCYLDAYQATPPSACGEENQLISCKYKKS